MSDLALIDATGQAQLVREGEVTPLELVEAAIERIEAVDPKLNAVIIPLYEEARAAASDGLPEGPFRGVPFLLKDLGAALAGQPLHMGMRLLKGAGFRSPVDTFLAQRFRDAGLVTLGKTNVPELGIKPTSEPRAYGPTRNPWDPSRTAGGSSGGAAAAVAAGMTPTAHASDGGGSIRIPASHCGLVGLKPTRARITRGPLIGDFAAGLSEELVVTRSVRDVAGVLDAVHGPEVGDPYVAPPPGRAYSDELAEEPGSMRVRVVTDAGLEVKAEPDCVEAARDAAELLESLGHEVTQQTLPSAAGSEELLGTFTLRFAAGHAAILDQLELVLGREIGPRDVEPLTWALTQGARERSAAELLRAVTLHQAAGRSLDAMLTSECDLLLTPTVGEPPPAIGSLDDDPDDPIASFARSTRSGMFTALLNMTGHPAISLPLHWTEAGHPIGVQLVAAFGREDLLIRVAAQLERARPWAAQTPPIFAARDNGRG